MRPRRHGKAGEPARPVTSVLAIATYRKYAQRGADALGRKKSVETPPEVRPHRRVVVLDEVPRHQDQIGSLCDERLHHLALVLADLVRLEVRENRDAQRPVDLVGLDPNHVDLEELRLDEERPSGDAGARACARERDHSHGLPAQPTRSCRPDGRGARRRCPTPDNRGERRAKRTSGAFRKDPRRAQPPRRTPRLPMPPAATRSPTKGVAW